MRPPRNVSREIIKKGLHFPDRLIIIAFVVMSGGNLKGLFIGLSPNGKALDSDSSIWGFESLKPS